VYWEGSEVVSHLQSPDPFEADLDSQAEVWNEVDRLLADSSVLPHLEEVRISVAWDPSTGIDPGSYDSDWEEAAEEAA
jgi:hypothetical protein